MNRERSEDVLVIAIVISIAFHILLMLGVRSTIMSEPLKARSAHRTAPVRVIDRVPRPEATAIAEFEDEEPKVAEAPVGESVEMPNEHFRLAEEAASAAMPKIPEVKELAQALPKLEAPILEAKVVGNLPPKAQVMTRLTVDELAPKPSTAGLAMAEVGKLALTTALPAPMPSAVAPAPRKIVEAPRIVQTSAKVAFTPSNEVYDKVDARIVEQEKAAVRQLMIGGDTVSLKPFVDMAMTRASDGKYDYFKLMIVPKRKLPVVPKDIVVIVDASGSIGSDRIGSIRKAAKAMLRSATNTGDRFNLVAFRDRYSYAFRSWQECTQSAFDNADKWLNNVAAHGRTDVFSTITSVLTLPRNPKRPLIALVITDGDANSGISDNLEIISGFTRLNNGLISVYMYGVKESANRELIEVLTHGNRGEGFIFDGWRWNAGDGIGGLAERFRDPVLSDLQVVFGSDCPADTYPRLLKNMYRGETLAFVGRVAHGARELAFSLSGLGGNSVYESFWTLSMATAAEDPKLISEWKHEQELFKGVK